MGRAQRAPPEEFGGIRPKAWNWGSRRKIKRQTDYGFLFSVWLFAVGSNHGSPQVVQNFEVADWNQRRGTRTFQLYGFPTSHVRFRRMNHNSPEEWWGSLRSTHPTNYVLDFFGNLATNSARGIGTPNRSLTFRHWSTT